MKTIAALLLLVSAPSFAGGIAFFKYSRTTGMTQQCVYDYLGSEYTITISSVDLCPLTINVPG